MWLNFIALILLIGGIIVHRHKQNLFVSLMSVISAVLALCNIAMS